MFDPLLSGQDLNAEKYVADLDNLGSTVWLSADSLPSTNTTYIDSTELVFPALDLAAYKFAGTLWWVSSATADIKIRIKVPVGAFGRVRWGDLTLAAEDDVSDAVEQSFSTSGGLEGISPSGFFTVTGGAGSVIVGHAQLTTTASNTLLKMGSHLTFTRIG